MFASGTFWKVIENGDFRFDNPIEEKEYWEEDWMNLRRLGFRNDVKAVEK